MARPYSDQLNAMPVGAFFFFKMNLRESRLDISVIQLPFRLNGTSVLCLAEQAAGAPLGITTEHLRVTV